MLPRRGAIAVIMLYTSAGDLKLRVASKYYDKIQVCPTRLPILENLLMRYSGVHITAILYQYERNFGESCIILCVDLEGIDAGRLAKIVQTLPAARIRGVERQQ